MSESAPEGHSPHLAHHFDNDEQQFNSAKLGMWLFLATEVLFFSGLFCAYVVFRYNYPEVFSYGAEFLDARLGAVNTVVLLISSLTMAIAVGAAQRGQKRTLIGCLVATFMGGAFFMGIKYVEYHHKVDEHLVWTKSFYQTPAWAAVPGPGGQASAASDATSDATVVAAIGDPDAGLPLWNATCRSCHGAGGDGVEGQGKAIHDYLSKHVDVQVVDFIKVGRRVGDPLNTTGVEMPPRGGNPLLKDQDLLNIAAFARALGSGGAPVVESELWIPVSSIPPPRTAPPGLRRVAAEDLITWHHSVDPERPPNAHLFFALYFCLTGLHGIHVVAGMIAIAWLVVGSIRGRYNERFFTPVDLTGLYWHLVDLVWIFLFPLLYLV